MTTAATALQPALPDASAACHAGQFVGAPVREGRHGSVRWHDDGRWVWGEVEADAAGDLVEPTRRAYTDLFGALADAGAPHLLRLWNRVPRINVVDGELERYRQFNIGRQQAFIDAGRDAFEGAPAACAVGTPAGPLGIRFLAGREPPVPIENPRQVSAYRYSSVWGPRAPTFSRAALAHDGDCRVALFISGTASIVGEHSVHVGDVRAQCEETLRNLDTVIAGATQRSGTPWRPEDFHWIVYLRHAAHWDDVRDTFATWCGTAPRQPLEADICREELLIEIEGHAFAAGAARR